MEKSLCFIHFWQLLRRRNLTKLARFLNRSSNAWWGPLLIVIGACGGILGVVAGVRIWLASASGDENKLKSSKMFLIYIIIGFAVVFILATIVPVIIAAFSDWQTNAPVDGFVNLFTRL